MALVDVSIVNASLPVIQGEIGATPSEGTWVGTSYLIAEIVTIPLTAWLERLLGMRRLLLASTTLFTFFSVVCGFAPDLATMIFGRVGQGMAGGILIPTSLTIVATRLPPAQQAVGLAITAMAALLGPIAGPLLGGWLTENFSWHLAFFMNVPICMLQIVLIMIAIPRSPANPSELRSADWFGIAGMVIGLGSVTTLLEEGHRKHWFESALIWQLAIASVVGFVLVAIGQIRSRRPVLKLSLLRDRNLGSAIALMGVVGMLLYSTLFLTPQFLAALAGYNALQAGQVAFISGLVAVPAAFIYPLMVARIDTRLIVAGAILSVSFAAYLASGLTADWVGADFLPTQLLYGIGTTLSAIPLQQTVISSVSVEDAAEGNSLISVSRNLGGSIGLAAIASFQEQRLEFHHWRLNESIGANGFDVQQALAEMAAFLGGGLDGLSAAYRALDAQILVQALTMTFNDLYLALCLVGLVTMPLVLFLRPLAPGAAPAAMH
ncbi:MAG: DHA2 family efflux MFS transporter permease subunit [Novosphingobium sp.]|nr:DHA2 family efflux MFS transporter permease subunit [Novosphingobium sp.]MCP5403985.1 DHA2 family efflux MFS transporter permease subunit [Novosphingobium sp.]